MRFVLAWLSCAGALSGCEANGSSDAGTDAPVVDAASGDASPDAPSDAPVCSVDPAPTGLPTLTGTFVVLDPDGGTGLPVLLGGDPSGVLRFDTATIYVGPTAGGMLDAAASSITGTGWVALDGSSFRMTLDLDLTLVTTVAGTIRRRQTTTLRGTYTVAGAMLEVAVECVEPPPMGTSMFQPTFGIEGGRGTLMLTLNGMLGMSTLVLSGVQAAE